MRIGFGRVQFQRSKGFPANQRRDLPNPAVVSSGKKIVKTQQSMRSRILWIKGDRMPAVFLRSRESLRQVASHVMPRFEQRLVGREIRRVSGWSGDELQLQRTGDGLSDFVLDCEYVCKLAVVAFGPQMITVLSVDELRRHTDAAAGASNAAFEDRADSQRFGNLGDVLVLAAEGESGGAGRDLEIGNVGQEVDDLLSQAIAEVFIVGVAAHVDEGQNCDGRK